ncbi:VOC family protein [Aeoliella mucimassa]|uniref:Glyoxalase-like domain protein n=1 Tax=Aeoliella mucimassa TaxID=2527972 RepID=A0A518AQ09_9BACT|nr:VOC family protein [Aeoliella mucimassa]QDU56809.1 Glyoxalase-like domain protein [Aeoliella mucimassa]
MPSPIVPTLKYNDAAAAIEWLCKAFGFKQHLVVPGENHKIDHAQLTYRDGMIMLGSVRNTELDGLQKLPSAVGGVCTQSAYVVVNDVDAHHARAVAAGAKVVMPPTDQDYGGRHYSCYDLEGHLWHFGSYNPWAEPSA